LDFGPPSAMACAEEVRHWVPALGDPGRQLWLTPRQVRSSGETSFGRPTSWPATVQANRRNDLATTQASSGATSGLTLSSAPSWSEVKFRLFTSRRPIRLGALPAGSPMAADLPRASTSTSAPAAVARPADWEDSCSRTVRWNKRAEARLGSGGDRAPIGPSGPGAVDGPPGLCSTRRREAKNLATTNQSNALTWAAACGPRDVLWPIAVASAKERRSV
jgi:hypothetical protein